MGIQSIEDSKKLKKCFEKVGREGISKRAIELLDEYRDNNPDHSYKEITKLIGRFHALYISIDNGNYWKEIANRGYSPEIWDLEKYSKEYKEGES